MHWIHDAVFYNIYPLGFCGAPKFNDFQQSYRLDKIYDFIVYKRLAARDGNAVKQTRSFFKER